MDNKRIFVVNFKRVLTYSVVIEGEYPQDVEKQVLEEANDPRKGIYDLTKASSTVEIGDMVTEAQAVSEFYGDQWFDPDFTRKSADETNTDLSKYGFLPGETPLPDCGCNSCAAYYKDHPFERRNQLE